MTLAEAEEHLTKKGVTFNEEFEGFFCDGWYVSWNKGDDTVTLDEQFTIKDLEAIIICMKEQGK